jgi:hypothetical protein
MDSTDIQSTSDEQISPPRTRLKLRLFASDPPGQQVRYALPDGTTTSRDVATNTGATNTAATNTGAPNAAVSPSRFAASDASLFDLDTTTDQIIRSLLLVGSPTEEDPGRSPQSTAASVLRALATAPAEDLRAVVTSSVDQPVLAPLPSVQRLRRVLDGIRPETYGSDEKTVSVQSVNLPDMPAVNRPAERHGIEIAERFDGVDTRESTEAVRAEPEAGEISETEVSETEVSETEVSETEVSETEVSDIPVIGPHRRRKGMLIALAAANLAVLGGVAWASRTEPAPVTVPTTISAPATISAPVTEPPVSADTTSNIVAAEDGQSTTASTVKPTTKPSTTVAPEITERSENSDTFFTENIVEFEPLPAS